MCGKLVVLCLILFNMYVSSYGPPCSPTLQTCRNCSFIFPYYCPISSGIGYDEEGCANLLGTWSGTSEVKASVYNADSGSCNWFWCNDDVIEYSPHKTLTRRRCSVGCRTIGLTEMINTKVVTTENITQSATSTSETQCINKCIRIASKHNISCTASFGGTYDTCNVYTSCASSGCQVEPYQPDWKVFVVTCGNSECSSLQSPGNGDVSTTGLMEGDTAHYQCHEGYQLLGSSTRTCLADSSWSDRDPTCNPVDCGYPDGLANGLLAMSHTTYLFNVNYGCFTGHTLIGNAIRTCQANALWSGAVPECIPVDCGHPSNLTNGTISISGTTFSHVATYSCLDGFSLSGESRRTCSESSTWSGTTPACNPIICRTPQAPAHGHVSTFGNKANYGCNTGFYLSTNESRTCLPNDIWDGEAPVCIAVDCGSLGVLENGTISVESTTYLSRAVYFCNAGFTPLFTNRTCQENGDWSSVAPVCQPVYCGNSPYLENGGVTIENTSVPVTANYACDTGYELNGANFSVCLSDGNWSNAIPVCEPINCGHLSSPENGSVLINGTSFLHIATYECIDGYKLSGQDSSSARVCQEDGFWNGTEPECVPVECPKLGNFTHGSINMSKGRQYGQVATYTCGTGYMLHGNKERICLQHASWSGDEPTCRSGIPTKTLTVPKPRRIYSHAAVTGAEVSLICQ